MAESKEVTQCDFRSEWERLRSFSTFPNHSGVSTIKLSREGFYYTGIRSVCRCYSCGTEHCHWSERQVPPHGQGCEWKTNNDPIHKLQICDRHSQCEGQESGNSEVSQSFIGDRNMTDTVCEAFEWLRIRYLPRETPKSPVATTRSRSMASNIFQYLRISEETPRRLGGNVISNQNNRDIVESDRDNRKPLIPDPSIRLQENTAGNTNLAQSKGKKFCFSLPPAHVDHPQAPSDKKVLETTFGREESVPSNISQNRTQTRRSSTSIRRENNGYTRSVRLATYRDWPPGLGPSTEDMMRAGFVYTGSGDKVTCPWCHFTRSGWKASDIPWQIHSQCSPRCSFVVRHRTPHSQVMDQVVHLEAFKEVLNFSFGINHTLRAFDVLSSTLDIRDITATDVLKYFLEDEGDDECCNENVCVCCSCPLDDVSRFLLLMPCRHGVCDRCDDNEYDLEECPSCGRTVKATHQVFVS